MVLLPHVVKEVAGEHAIESVEVCIDCHHQMVGHNLSHVTGLFILEQTQSVEHIKQVRQQRSYLENMIW